jgi:hypothetical protein
MDQQERVMRQTISGLLAALALMTAGAAPALACGGEFYQGCAPPAPVYSGCGGCWAHERLPDPVQQYYYVNQGPTYSGSGDFAPYPTYQESAVSGWDAYRRRPYYYGYDGGRYADTNTHYYDGAGVDGPVVYSYPERRHFRPWRMHHGYGYFRPGHMGYGTMPHYGMRYGAHVGMMHRHEHMMMHRYN